MPKVCFNLCRSVPKALGYITVFDRANYLVDLLINVELVMLINNLYEKFERRKL